MSEEIRPTLPNAGFVDGPVGKLAYARGGSGPALVMLHAIGLSGAMWNPIVSTFSSAFDVIAMDARGHGMSETDGNAFDVTDLADDVLTLMDALQLDKPNLIGLSMGGSTALTFAGKYPDRVDRLALCDTTEWYGPDGRDRFFSRAELVRSSPRTEHLPEQIERWFNPEFRISHPKVVEELSAIYLQANSDAHAEACEALARLDSRGFLPEITASTLVLSGQDQFATPPERGNAIASGIADAHYVSVPGRHFALLENAKAPQLAIDHLQR